MPTTTDDGIQDNGDENVEDQIQNNVNENMIEDDSIISPSTSNSLWCVIIFSYFLTIFVTILITDYP